MHGERMKCQYLQKINTPAVLVADIVCVSGQSIKLPIPAINDILICQDPDDNCPKKKQRHEINRRCWEMKR